MSAHLNWPLLTDSDLERLPEAVRLDPPEPFETASDLWNLLRFEPGLLWSTGTATWLDSLQDPAAQAEARRAAGRLRNLQRYACVALRAVVQRVPATPEADRAKAVAALLDLAPWLFLDADRLLAARDLEDLLGPATEAWPQVEAVVQAHSATWTGDSGLALKDVFLLRDYGRRVPIRRKRGPPSRIRSEASIAALYDWLLATRGLTRIQTLGFLALADLAASMEMAVEALQEKLVTGASLPAPPDLYDHLYGADSFAFLGEFTRGRGVPGVEAVLADPSVVERRVENGRARLRLLDPFSAQPPRGRPT